MKTKISILCCALFLLTSCIKDDENTHPIIGTWHLTQTTNGWTGTTDYNRGDILWIFDENNVTFKDNLANSEETHEYSTIEHEGNLFTHFDDFFPTLLDNYFFYTEINDDEMIINTSIVRTIIDNDTIATGISDASVHFFER